MAVKKETKETKATKPIKQDDELMIKVLEQLDILNNAIKMIDQDMATMFDKVKRLCNRVGIE